MGEVDILAAFENVLSKSSSSNGSNRREGSFPYASFDMTKKMNRGKVFGVLIPDSRNIPLRVIKNVCTTWLTYVDEEGNEKSSEFRWCDSGNYKDGVLSEADKELNTKVKEELDTYVNNYSGEWSPVKTSSKVTIFYFAITKTVSDENGEVQKYNNPGCTLMIHRAAAFPESIGAAMKAKTEGLDDTEWVRQFFNRKPGIHDKVVAVSTSLKGSGQPGYNIGISFDELKNLSANIDDSHLTKANNLDEEYINIDKYDRAYYENMLSILVDINKNSNKLDSAPVAEPTAEDPNLTLVPELTKSSASKLMELD